jgi:hypothetical protein
MIAVPLLPGQIQQKDIEMASVTVGTDAFTPISIGGGTDKKEFKALYGTFLFIHISYPASPNVCMWYGMVCGGVMLMMNRKSHSISTTQLS